MSKRVLVAEDDSAIRNLVLRVLRREGFEIEAVNNGREAIAYLTARDYGAIVLDLMMPEGSGFDVVAWVAAERPRIARKLIVITAVAERDIRRIQEGEVFAIIRKPFDLRDLVEAVRSATGEGENEPGDLA